MSRVLFLHGSSVSPLRTRRGGRLQEAGHEVELCPALPYPDDSTALWRAMWTEDNRPWFDQAVQIAQDAYDRCRPDVVVGSSMGGAVAMNLETGATPQVLVAPAWRVWWIIPFGRVHAVKPATVIVQGDEDWLVRPVSSRRLLERSAPRQGWEAERTTAVERGLGRRFQRGGELTIEGRLVRVAGADHRCNSEPAIRALLGAVEVLLGLPPEVCHGS